MKSRHLTAPLAIALAGLMMLVAVAADAQRRQPKGETSSSSGSRGSTAVRAPQSSSPPPARTAVPRSDRGDRSERSDRVRSQRHPQRDGDDRARGGDYGRGYHYPVYRSPYSLHPWFWWGPFYGYYSPYPWGYGTYWYPDQVHEGMGALDLDVKPEEAEVYLDGYRIGIADNFDGWPRYLWLEEGTYDLVFYHEGFETIARQYSIYPGVVIDVEDRMVRGEAELPDDLVERSRERREARMARVAEERGGDERAPAPWRDRVASERSEMDGDDYVDARSEPARLRLRVIPSDAAVYLDGRFLGTGDELGGVRAGLIVDAGEHELEVTRPGYETATETFTAETGEEVEVEIELEEE